MGLRVQVQGFRSGGPEAVDMHICININRSIYLSIYLYIYTDHRVATCICIDAYNMCKNLGTHTYVYIFMYACIHTYVHTHTYMHACIHIQSCIYLYVYIYTYVYAHMYVYV